MGDGLCYCRKKNKRGLWGETLRLQKCEGNVGSI